MFRLSVKNAYGKKIDLTRDRRYTVYDIDGLSPVDATLNFSRNANSDGSVFNSAYLSNRQIIITLTLDYQPEKARVQLYRFFQSKSKIDISFKNSVRDVEISGYVQNMVVGFFEKKQTAQITVICPDPLFKDTETKKKLISDTDYLFKFPFAIPKEGIEFSRVSEESKEIENGSDIDIGVTIEITASTTTDNPKIINSVSGDFLGFDLTLNAGETITVCTIPKQKKAVLTDANGNTTNVIGKLMPGSTWLQLEPGTNEFSLSSDNFYAQFEYTELYEGV